MCISVFEDIANLSFRETVSVFIQLAMVQCFSIICLFLVVNYFNIISDINEYSITISGNCINSFSIFFYFYDINTFEESGTVILKNVAQFGPIFSLKQRINVK